MFKRTILIGLGLLLIAAGFATYQYISYSNSTDRVADDFIKELVAGNIDAVYEQLSPELQRTDKTFWQESVLFREVAGYKGSIKRLSSNPLKSTDPSQPDPYISQEGVEALRYIYELRINSLAYHLSFDLVRHSGEEKWQINALEGTYAAAS